MNCTRTAFTLRDLVFSVAALGAFAAISIPAISQVRMDSSRQACIGNYRFIAQASGSYSNDYAGYMWALSWRGGMRSPEFPNPYLSSDVDAQGTQAGLILRRLANLTPTQSPIPIGWMSPLLFSHTALLDYVNIPIPAGFMVCPDDFARRPLLEGDFSKLWASGSDGSSVNWRQPYSSSYVIGTSHWGPSRQTMVPQYAGAPDGPFVASPMWFQTSSNYSIWTSSGYSTAPNVNGPKQESSVRFPSSKVFMSDEYARHNGAPRFFAYQSASQDLLFYDGSVRFFRTDSTNPGWDPSTATNRGNMKRRFSFTKTPDFWGKLDNNASSANFPAGWYRWTRGGLFGWDVPRMSSMRGKLPNANIVENEVDTSAATGAW